MSRRPPSHRKPKKPRESTLLRRYRKAIQRYIKPLSSSRLTKPNQKNAQKKMPSDGNGYPYDIPPLPFALNSSEWNNLDKASALLFFRYETWLRAPAVWQYIRAGNPIVSRHTIGGISVQLLDSLLKGSHHKLLKPREDPLVRDVAAELTHWENGLFLETVRPLVKDKLAILMDQIIETAQELWKGEPANHVYLVIRATADLEEVKREIEQIVVQRRERLEKSFIFSSEIEAQKAAAKRRRGSPYDWTVWARRLVVWDLKTKNPKMSFEEIARTVFDLPREVPSDRAKGSYEFEAAKRAHEAFIEAEIMIKAAEAGGPWPPVFPRRATKRNRSEPPAQHPPNSPA